LLEAAKKHPEGSGKVIDALVMTASYDPDPTQFRSMSAHWRPTSSPNLSHAETPILRIATSGVAAERGATHFSPLQSGV